MLTKVINPRIVDTPEGMVLRFSSNKKENIELDVGEDVLDYWTENGLDKTFLEFVLEMFKADIREELN